MTPDLVTWRPEMRRDLGCGEVRPEHAGRTLALAGWVHRVRDLGGMKFFELRDRTGLVQLVVNREEVPAEVYERCQLLRPEYGVAARGRVRRRGCR